MTSEFSHFHLSCPRCCCTELRSSDSVSAFRRLPRASRLFLMLVDRSPARKPASRDSKRLSNQLARTHAPFRVTQELPSSAPRLHTSPAASSRPRSRRWTWPRPSCGLLPAVRGLPRVPRLSQHHTHGLLRRSQRSQLPKRAESPTLRLATPSHLPRLDASATSAFITASLSRPLSVLSLCHHSALNTITPPLHSAATAASAPRAPRSQTSLTRARAPRALSPRRRTSAPRPARRRASLPASRRSPSSLARRLAVASALAATATPRPRNLSHLSPTELPDAPRLLPHAGTAGRDTAHPSSAVSGVFSFSVLMTSRLLTGRRCCPIKNTRQSSDHHSLVSLMSPRIVPDTLTLLPPHRASRTPVLSVLALVPRHRISRLIVATLSDCASRGPSSRHRTCLARALSTVPRHARRAQHLSTFPSTCATLIRVTCWLDTMSSCATQPRPSINRAELIDLHVRRRPCGTTAAESSLQLTQSSTRGAVAPSLTLRHVVLQPSTPLFRMERCSRRGVHRI